MSEKKIVIKNRANDRVVASSPNPLRFESNYYFDEEEVNMGQLEVTDRTYRCWYKGQCFWVDLKREDGTVQENVAWVYRTPNRGFKGIKDKFGFYPWGSGDLSVESSD